MRPSRRDHLVQTALRLFMSDGFHATGIDAILAEAGCAKMTLYNHFKSKNELIVAALERRDHAWREWFQEAVERRASSPRDRMLAIFVALEEWYRQDFRGCAFINASAEYPRRNHPIHRAAARHKAPAATDKGDLLFTFSSFARNQPARRAASDVTPRGDALRCSSYRRQFEIEKFGSVAFGAVKGGWVAAVRRYQEPCLNWRHRVKRRPVPGNIARSRPGATRPNDSS